VGKTHETIKQFAANKAASPDGIKPIILQNHPKSILIRLGIIYKQVWLWNSF
jgi:hypothetical protein